MSSGSCGEQEKECESLCAWTGREVTHVSPHDTRTLIVNVPACGCTSATVPVRWTKAPLVTRTRDPTARSTAATPPPSPSPAVAPAPPVARPAAAEKALSIAAASAAPSDRALSPCRRPPLQPRPPPRPRPLESARFRQRSGERRWLQGRGEWDMAKLACKRKQNRPTTRSARHMPAHIRPRPRLHL